MEHLRCRVFRNLPQSFGLAAKGILGTRVPGKGFIRYQMKIRIPPPFRDKMMSPTVPCYISSISHAAVRSHRVIRSMHRCPPQLNRFSYRLVSPLPRVLFLYFLFDHDVPRPRATFSHRNSDILSRIARVSCDPFFFFFFFFFSLP